MRCVEVHLDVDLPWVDAGRIRTVTEGAMAAEGVRGIARVVVVDDSTIHDINRRFLDHDEPTDVITFDLAESAQDNVDGEIFVSADTAWREGKARGHDPMAELCFYCVHGVLHLTGWDDASAADRKKMLRRQDEILLGLGQEAVS